ncbi:MAG: tRNA (cytidine(34)-2'-O)-methyltransferase [Bacilli bacterium]|nr:tRNA (cytidine(34)-2'-O)-methyltransferase [Bacilli bacterium]
MSPNNIVLFQPEIPQNVGNVMRTVLAANAALHLIEPLGFSMASRYIARSGVNYIDKVDYHLYRDIDEFFEKNQGEYYFLTRYGQRIFTDHELTDKSKNYYFILGRESTGIPKEILKSHLDYCIRLPMTDKVRALNLSNVAAIVLYEALRQQGYPNLSHYEPDSLKGSNYLCE